MSILKDSLTEFVRCEASKAGITPLSKVYNGEENIRIINEWFSKEYETSLDPFRDFDERLLFHNFRKEPHSPVMMHPFERQGNANVRYAPEKIENEATIRVERSKRLLKFDTKEKDMPDVSEKGKDEVTNNTNDVVQKPFKFPCIATPSPFGAKHFPIITPLTKVKEMNEWLNSSVKAIIIEKNKLSHGLNIILTKEGQNVGKIEQ